MKPPNGVARVQKVSMRERYDVCPAEHPFDVWADRVGLGGVAVVGRVDVVAGLRAERVRVGLRDVGGRIDVEELLDRLDAAEQAYLG